MDNFIVVSDVYPGISTKVADLVLPAAMIFEKWGAYGNADDCTQMLRVQVPPPGQARSDIWQIMEFSKRFKLKEVWGEQKIPGLKAEGFADGVMPEVLTGSGYSAPRRPVWCSMWCRQRGYRMQMPRCVCVPMQPSCSKC